MYGGVIIDCPKVLWIKLQSLQTVGLGLCILKTRYWLPLMLVFTWLAHLLEAKSAPRFPTKVDVGVSDRLDSLYGLESMNLVKIPLADTFCYQH